MIDIFQLVNQLTSALKLAVLIRASKVETYAVHKKLAVIYGTPWRNEPTTV